MPINEPRELIIAYDIADPKRLARVHRLMKKLALPLQYSVFYTRMNDRQKQQMIKLLEKKINPKQDDIRIYPLVTNYVALYLGHSPFMDGLQMSWQCGQWSEAVVETLVKSAKKSVKDENQTDA